MLLLARIVRLVTFVVVAFIVGGILVNVLDANMSNAIVSFVDDAARTLVGPFKNLFSISDENWNIIVNWGLAALVWFIVGSVIAALLARAGLGFRDRWRWRRRDPAY